MTSANDAEAVPTTVSVRHASGPVVGQISGGEVTFSTYVQEQVREGVLTRRHRWFSFSVCLVMVIILIVMATQVGPGPDGSLVALWMIIAVLLVTGVAAAPVWTSPVTSAGTVAAADESSARSDILDRIQMLWIEQALHRSLREVIRLEVSLDEQADAVLDPWATAAFEALGDPDPLPEGMQLAGIYNQESRRRIVLVGAPGAGKTTHLLQLTDHLLVGARTNATAPIPIVLRLSEWTGRREELGQWVIDELGLRYSVAPATAQRWLRAGTVALLLDGLDEVAERRRESCLKAIDDFCRDPGHRRTGVVLTCRTVDYERLGFRLAMDYGVRVRPLEPVRVREALRSLGEPVAALRADLEVNRNLQELLTTPLTLSVAILATESLSVGTRIEPERLWSLYILKMLRRTRTLRRELPGTGPVPLAVTEATVHHLIWLARLMTRVGRTAFYPDALTPTWLPGRGPNWTLPERRGPISRVARRIGWDHASTGLLGSGYTAVLVLVAGLPLGAQVNGWIGALVIGLAASSITATLVFVAFALILPSSESEPRTWFFFGKQDPTAYSAARWTWSPAAAFRAGVLTMLPAGVVFVIGTPLTSLDEGVAVFLITVLAGTMGGGNIPDHDEPVSSPGNALNASLRRLVATETVFALIALALVVVVAVSGGPWTAVAAAFPFAAGCMVISGPGRAWLRNRAAYFGVVQAGFLPRETMEFLQYADDRILLRRAGGGFQFVHRTLQEFLVDQDPETYLRDELRQKRS